MAGLGSRGEVTVWERAHAEVMLRRAMRADETMLQFASNVHALDYLTAQSRHGRLEVRSPLRTTGKGTYVIVGRPMGQRTREVRRPRAAKPPAQPRLLNIGIVLVILAPVLIIGGLLIWQPLWTLLTIAGIVALLVYLRAQHGGSVFVEVLTRVRVRR